MPHLTVSHVGGRRFDIEVEGHRLVIDRDGGHAAGPTASELFVASLAACAASTAEAFMSARSLNATGLMVACHYQLSVEAPRRVTAIDLTLSLSGELPARVRADLVQAIQQCTVMSSLRQPPEVAVIVTAHSGANVT